MTKRSMASTRGFEVRRRTTGLSRASSGALVADEDMVKRNGEVWTEAARSVRAGSACDVMKE